MAEHDMPKSSITQYNNSYAAREKATEDNKPQAEKVVTGRVISAKKTPGQRFKETFFNGDDAKTVGSAILMDVVVPAIKETLFRSIQDAMSMFLWGDTRAGYRGGGKNDYTPYNSIYSINRSSKSRDTLVSNRLNDRADYTNLIFESRLDADDILYRLRDSINTYPCVTVMYLYDLIGKRTTPQDDKWGWTDLSGARIKQVRGGYLLELPPPIHLD